MFRFFLLDISILVKNKNVEMCSKADESIRSGEG